MSVSNSTKRLNYLEIIASSVFIFLAILLSISRVPYPESITPGYIVAFATIITTLPMLFMRGYKAALVSILALMVFFALLTTWAYATNSFFSPGDDDYGYHILAVWELANGWDPFTTPHDNIWLDSYPTGLYVLESYLVSLTGLLLSGRALVVGLVATIALLACNFYYTRLAPHFPYFKCISAILFAGIVVGNPVVITQATTHYVDAPLYLFGCALVFFLLSDAYTTNRLAILGAFCCIILMVNTKTAALYFVPLIVIGGFVVDLILKRNETGIISRAFKWIRGRGILYCCIFIFGIVVIGYKPFVTNIQDHGEFLYPSVNEIMEGNVPMNVLSLPSPVKFVYGIASATGESLWPLPFHSPIELKIPGTFELGEFIYLRFDTRRGGFGPLFSLALIAAMLAYATSRIASRNKEKYDWKGEGDAIAAFSLVILLASVFFPESWWARYVPFVWLCAILFAVSSLFLTGKGALIVCSRTLFGIAFISFLGCILAGMGGAYRINHLTYNKTLAVEGMKSFPVVHLYPEIDPRITTDFQSTTITSAGDTWGRLLTVHGVNVVVFNGVGNEIDLEKKCLKSGWLDADVLWCYPINAKPLTQ